MENIKNFVTSFSTVNKAMAGLRDDEWNTNHPVETRLIQSLARISTMKVAATVISNIAIAALHLVLLTNVGPGDVRLRIFLAAFSCSDAPQGLPDIIKTNKIFDWCAAASISYLLPYTYNRTSATNKSPSDSISNLDSMEKQSLQEEVISHHANLRLPLHAALFISPLILLLPSYLIKSHWSRVEVLNVGI